MTVCVCLSVPDKKCNVPLYFSPLISFELITRTALGRAVLGSHANGKAYLLSVSGRSEGLVGRGARRDRLHHLFVNGVIAILNEVASVSFLIAW